MPPYFIVDNEVTDPARLEIREGGKSVPRREKDNGRWRVPQRPSADLVTPADYLGRRPREKKSYFLNQILT